jgi:hypothetical protein
MHRHVWGNALFAVLISAALGIGCDGSADGGEKVALSSIIPEPVPIDLGLATGTMTFDFSSHPLDLDQKYDLEMFFYTGGIAVTVANNATGVTYSLTEGAAVMTTPDQAGEYFVGVSADGKIVTVSFYNWFEGRTVEAGGDYSATVDVLDNEFFVAETFTRGVTVS